MKKRKTFLFSLIFFFIALLILGQQEIKKTQILLENLAKKEVDSFVFTTFDFAETVKSEATPFVSLVNIQSIEDLLIAKCRLGENIFLEESGGQQIVLNSYGDAGVIQYEIQRGGKIITANRQMELDYFRKEALPSFKVNSFGSGQIFFYFFNRIIFLLFVVLVPFFFSLKLFILLISILIIVISLLATKQLTARGNSLANVAKEYCLKKPPPPGLEKITDFHSLFILKEFITPDQLVEYVPILIRIIFFENLIEKTRKFINKIFHIPVYNFVIN